MKLQGKKIAILIENGFEEPEIWFYKYRFPEEGCEVHFLSRLWKQSFLEFKGIYGETLKCEMSFEGMDDSTLRSYAAIIVPSGTVSDRLRFSKEIDKLPPASEFLKRAFEEKDILKGIICHGLWLAAPTPELVRGRRLVVSNNLIGDAKNMGALYVDEDVVVDGDLVTARTAKHCNLFARKIIDLLSQR